MPCSWQFTLISCHVYVLMPQRGWNLFIKLKLKSCSKLPELPEQSHAYQKQLTLSTVTKPLCVRDTPESFKKSVAGTTPIPSTQTSASRVVPSLSTACFTWPPSPLNSLMPFSKWNFTPLSSCSYGGKQGENDKKVINDQSKN